MTTSWQSGRWLSIPVHGPWQRPLLPRGSTAVSLPVGLQLIALPLGEVGQLRIALAFEHAAPGWQQRPAIAPA